MLALGADLDVEVHGDDGVLARGRLSGSGSRLVLDIDRPAAVAGRRDGASVSALAEVLDALGVVLDVRHDGQRLVSIGAVRAPWWQRRATGSARIRLGSLRGLITSAGARARSSEPVLPGPFLPPPTPFPLLPGLGPRFRPRVTTTHDPAHGGSPRLVSAVETAAPGERQPVYWLGETTVIGSDASCDIVLEGLAPQHAVVEHDAADEYVVIPVDRSVVRVHGQRVVRQLLRTGSRLEVGEHVLVYRREEYADHGRPFGGRVGGELGHQKRQPPREAMEGDA